MAMVQLALSPSATLRKLRRMRTDAPRLIARALNRALDSAAVAMVRVIADDLRLRQAEVKGRVHVRPSTAADHTGRVYANARPISLYHFGASGPRPSRGRRGTSVSANLGRGRRKYPGAFIAEQRGRHGEDRGPAVFVRASTLDRTSRAGGWGPNLPIVKLHGPSVAHVFTRHVKVGLARGREQFSKNIRHEYRYALLQAAGTA